MKSDTPTGCSDLAVRDPRLHRNDAKDVNLPKVPPARKRRLVEQGRRHDSSRRGLGTSKGPCISKICPQGPILTRIGPCDRGRKPPLTCGDAVEPPIGIEPMTYSLRGSYTHGKHPTGRYLPRQPRQLSRVSMTRSKSCMPKIRPRERRDVVPVNVTYSPRWSSQSK